MKLKNIMLSMSFLNCVSVSAFEMPTLEGVKQWLTFMKMEDVSAEYHVKTPAQVIVLNNYGNTTVEVWNLLQVKVIGTKQARQEDTLKATAVLTHMTEHDGRSVITIETKSPEEDKTVVDYTIFVPKGTDLRIAHQRKGSVLIKALNYSPEAHAQLGNVMVTTNKGSIMVQSENAITHTMMLKTGKGNVQLTIPKTTNARLEAFTRKGTITSTIPVTLDQVTTPLSAQQWQLMMQHVQGMLGTEAQGFISIDVASGNISIENE